MLVQFVPRPREIPTLRPSFASPAHFSCECSSRIDSDQFRRWRGELGFKNLGFDQKAALKPLSSLAQGISGLAFAFKQSRTGARVDWKSAPYLTIRKYK
jgi:hypothetical protein